MKSLLQNETPVTLVPDPELQGYERPYHWFLPRESVWTRIHDVYVARAVQLVKETNAQRVLEVGCGDGWNCDQLVAAGIDATGVDWSQRGIALATCLVPRATFAVGDLTDPHLRSRISTPFDAVLLVEVIEHIHPDECCRALGTISQCVRPGGSIVLTTPSVNYPNTNPKHFRHFSPESLRQLIDEVGGLRLAHLEGYGDSRTLKLFNMVKPVVDGRFLRIKPALNRMLAYCERRAERVPPERALGLIARIEVQP